MPINRLLLVSAFITLFFIPRTNAQNENSYVTRAEAVTFILRNRNPTVPVLENGGKYADVAENDWYTKFVIMALEMNMWEPDKNSNRARPFSLVSRGEYIRMLSVAFNLPKNMPFPYTDINLGNELVEYAGIAAMYQLFYDPTDPTRLREYLPVTHEEASQAYFKLLQARPDLSLPTHSFTRKENTYKSDGSKNDRNILTTYMTVISRAYVKNALQQHVQNQLPYAEEVQSLVIEEVNLERQKLGIPPLKINKSLQTAAQRHAKDMVERGYFSHFSPEGESYVDRIKNSGYTDVDPITCECKQIFNLEDGDTNRTTVGPDYIIYEENICSCKPKYALGENIAKGQMTPKEVVKDWMNSPGHRRNILEPAFMEMGLGIFQDIWVQNFGKFVIE